MNAKESEGICTCTGAGNGMKWFNPNCARHGFNRPLPDRRDMPTLPKEFSDKLIEAFGKWRKK